MRLLLAATCAQSCIRERFKRVRMTIERALVGLFGAVAAATAASRAGAPVPETMAADPGAFFQQLVELRGETEMKRHAERLAVHLLNECKAGRATLGSMEARLATLTSLVTSFPPKPKALEEALDRSTGRSPAASALILASAIVSRAQARGRPEQARIDAPWATDMIAEALAGLLSDAKFLAGVERAFAAAANEPPSHVTAVAQPVMSRVQLRQACIEHGLRPDKLDAVVELKATQLQEFAASLAAAKLDMADPLSELHGQAIAALEAGELALAAERLGTLAKRSRDEGRLSIAATYAAGLAQLEDIRMAPRAAAVRFAEAFTLAPRAEASRRWGYALRQAGMLASEADDLARQGLANNRPLAEAVRVYASVLGLLPAGEAPDLRSVTHNSLGNTLLRLAEIEGKADLFAHAANSYRAAIGFMDAKRAGREWALVQSNLGNALLKGGELAHAERNYEEAAAAYDKALQVLGHESDAADWAAAEAGRGMAQGRLGAIRNDLGLLERTARAVDAALAQLDRRQAPAQWARLQSCLGNICADLGERIGGRHWLERAITAYEAAQEEWTEVRSPLQWALSEANRGGAHLGLGTLTRSRRHLHLAEDSLAHANAIFMRLGQSAYAAAAEQSLQAVRAELGEAVVAPQLDLQDQRARV